MTKDLNCNTIKLILQLLLRHLSIPNEQVTKPVKSLASDKAFLKITAKSKKKNSSNN